MSTWLHFGAVWAPKTCLGSVLAHLGASWGHLGASWERLGGVLEASWGVLEASWAPKSPKINLLQKILKITDLSMVFQCFLTPT